MSFDPRNHPGSFGSVAPDTNVPSFMPQMASIPEMLAQFADRRMQLAKLDQAKQEEARKQAHAEQTDAYYKHRLEQGDKKQETQDEFQRQKHNQDARKGDYSAIGSGRNPGTSLRWVNGKPVTVKWKFMGGDPAQEPMAQAPETAQPAAPPPSPPAEAPQPEAQPVPTLMGRPLSIPQLRAPGMGGGPLPPSAPPAQEQAQPEPQQPDQQLEALMAKASQPQEPQPQGQQGDNTVFLDENNDGTGRALMPPGDTGRRELPMRAFPEGAKEGDRFAAEDVNLNGGYGNPFASPVPPAQMRRPPEGGTVFVDETEDGQARALSGLDDGNSQQLPMDAFPPGAKEGDRFNAEDVSRNGGKGNPFAGPTAPIEMPQVQREAQNTNNLLVNDGAPQSSSMFVPSAQVRGYSARVPQQGGEGRWVAYDEQGNEVDSIDPAQARAANDEEARAEFDQTNRAIASMPNTPETQQARQILLNRAHLVVSGMSPQMQAQSLRDLAASGRQTTQIASTEGLAGKKIASTEGMAAAALASKEKLAAEANATRRATSKYGRAGSGSGKTPAQSSGQGSAFAALKPNEQSRIENAANNGVKMLDSQMNWTKLEGAGFDRLNLALQNIRAKGDLGGAQQMEAMMNFFGYIRGGVPAKNETDEFKSITRTLGTTLDSLGQKVGFSDLWTNFTGSDKDKAAIAKIAQLPEGQRAGLEQAIVESQRAIQGMALKNISAQIEGYKSAGRPFHERIQDKINAKLRFIGEKPRQWFQDSPLIPDFDPQAAPSQPSPAAPQQSAPAKSGGIDAKLDALNKALGL